MHGVERVSFTLKKGRYHGGEGGQARRSLHWKEESVSVLVDLTSLQEDLQSFGFAISLDKPEMKKEVGRRRTLIK